MPPTVQVSLSGVAVGVDDQRMQVNPPTSIRRQFYSVGSPIGLYGVAQCTQSDEEVVLKFRVEVQVHITMRSCLVAD